MLIAIPPVIRTLPLGRSVAVWPARGVIIEPVAVNVPDDCARPMEAWPTTIQRTILHGNMVDSEIVNICQPCFGKWPHYSSWLALPLESPGWRWSICPQVCKIRGSRFRPPDG